MGISRRFDPQETAVAGCVKTSNWLVREIDRFLVKAALQT
jgi:hypothetical protein